MASQNYVELSKCPASASPYGTDEILILPNPYFQRLVKQITTPNSFHENNGNTIELVFQEMDFFRLPQKGPLIIYSLPGLGSTSLLVNYIHQIKTNNTFQCPKLLIMYVDMKKASNVISKNPSANWSLSEFLAEYHEISGTPFAEKMKNILSKKDANDQVNLHYDGEVFFDGLDKATPSTLGTILNMLAKVEWNNNSIRVWVSARTHMKTIVNKALNPSSTFELLPLSMDNQIGYFMACWDKAKAPTPKHRVQIFLGEMEKKIPGYHNTIGGCPSHCSFIRNVFHDLGQTIMTISEKQIVSKIASISVSQVFEEFVILKLDYYDRNFSWEQKSEIEEEKFVCDMKYKRLDRAHLRHAVSTYPSFIKESTTLYYDNQYAQMYNIGILFENNGIVQFLHPMYAEYIISQFLVNSGRLKSTGLHHISFFLNKVLFENGAKGIRKMFDSYWILQQKRKLLRESVKWSRVRCFLIDHYHLEPSLESPEAPEEYEKIKNNGNILHLAILEQNFKLFQVLIDSLKGPYCDKLTKLLRMGVNLDIYDSNLFYSRRGVNVEGATHLVTTLDLLAMFCRDEEHASIINNVCQILGFDSTNGRRALIDRCFAPGTWTILHYAAMNSNYVFINAMFVQREFPCDIPNPNGILPIHLVLHDQWYYAMKIVDHPHPQLRGLQGNKLKTNSEDSKEIWCFEGIVKHLKDYKDIPLHEDKLRPHLLTLKYLFTNGADVNAKNGGDEKTILHQAVEISSMSLIVIQYLLTFGANPNLKDCFGRTPLYYAELSKERKLVWNMLRENGAVLDKNIVDEDLTNDDFEENYNNDNIQFMEFCTAQFSPQSDESSTTNDD